MVYIANPPFSATFVETAKNRIPFFVYVAVWFAGDYEKISKLSLCVGPQFLTRLAFWNGGALDFCRC